MDERNGIGELEELVLLCVLLLDGNAYGVTIREELIKSAERELNISSVHTTLDRMEKKGFVESYMGGASEERGGRRKRLFKVTAYGARILRSQKQLREGFYKRIELDNPQFGILHV